MAACCVEGLNGSTQYIGSDILFSATLSEANRPQFFDLTDCQIEASFYVVGKDRPAFTLNLVGGITRTVNTATRQQVEVAIRASHTASVLHGSQVACLWRVETIRVPIATLVLDTVQQFTLSDRSKALVI